MFKFGVLYSCFEYDEDSFEVRSERFFKYQVFCADSFSCCFDIALEFAVVSLSDYDVEIFSISRLE